MWRVCKRAGLQGAPEDIAVTAGRVGWRYGVVDVGEVGADNHVKFGQNTKMREVFFSKIKPKARIPRLPAIGRRRKEVWGVVVVRDSVAGVLPCRCGWIWPCHRQGTTQRRSDQSSSGESSITTRLL